MTADLPVAIVGAGIAGLAAALALASRGREVVVLERSVALYEVGAGIQLSPNASRILVGMGLGGALSGVAVEPEAIAIRSAMTGERIVTLPLSPTIAARYGAPFLVIHRGDLQAALLSAVSADKRIRLHLGAGLAGIEETDRSIRLHLDLASGAVAIDAEALVGADGVRSVVRTGVLGGGDAVYSGRVAWRTTIPAEAWSGDDEVRRSTGLWLGTRAHMVHYPLRGGRDVNLVVVVEEPWAEARSDTSGEGSALLGRFAEWPEAARALVAAAPGWRRWALSAVDPAGTWTRGRIALVGDAAHAMLPFAAQGGAMAIEDAAVLARELVDGEGTVPERLEAYARTRRSRVVAVAAAARRNGAIYHLGGSAAVARDAMMRLLGPRRLLGRLDWIYGWRDRP